MSRSPTLSTPVELFELEGEHLLDRAERGRAVDVLDTERVADVEGGHIALVEDLAHELLEHVLEGDHTDRVASVIDHDRRGGRAVP